MSKNNISRRTFIFGSAIMAAGCATTGRRPYTAPRAISPNEKLNIAGVGVGGMGHGDISHAGDGNNVVALCDVDWRRAARAFESFPDAPKYKDFRVMLDREYHNIDAVTISTPDHMHAPIAMAAMQMGKHVYVQKPLSHNVYEARRLRDAARRYGVATQMGNQGHAGEGVRRLTEWIRGGAIGTVREAHVWTNRPVWPQAIPRPEGVQKVPETLDWDLWQGVAQRRPYNRAYLPFNWRGWWDYGCGALGDMGCHNMDPAYTALNLGYPTSIEAVHEGNNEETFPEWSVITYEFPARGDMPPVKLVWYDGGQQPVRPEGLGPDETLGDGDNGTLFIGDNGMMACGTYGGGPCLIPTSRMADFQRPPRTIPNSTGIYQEWIDLCKGIKPPEGGWTGDFEYAAPFTEMVLLGNVAIKAGRKIEYDPANMRITNCPEANQYLQRTYPRGYRHLA